MTSRVHAGVGLAPDAVLPRRDDLLDEDLVAARLEELGRRAGNAPTVRACERVRARYRRGESLRATYRVTDQDGSRLVSARMFTSVKAASRFDRARDAAEGEGAPAGSVLFDESLDTVFWVFPHDRKLRGLADLTCPPPGLRHMFAAPWVASELVAYTPEKAATVRCLDQNADAVGFAKVQVDEEGRRSVETLTAVRRGLPEASTLRLPEPVGYLPERRLALFSAVPGRPLHELERAAVPDAMTALGVALTVLHRGPTRGLPSFTRLGPGRLSDAGMLLRAVRPDLAKLTESVVQALLSDPVRPTPAVLLHGDLHPKNVLVDGTVIGLVDLDQAAAGPAGAELGGIAARLWCPRPGDEIDRETASAAANALLAAYTGGPRHADLLWYAAAALLVERAVRAVNRVDLATLADLEQVLETALHWVSARTVEQP